MTDERSRILGIDPGSRLCGWGLVEVDGNRVSHVDNGVIVLTQHGEMPARLGHLLTQINRVLDQYRPTDVAVEEVFQYRNARTALVLGHARGVAIAALVDELKKDEFFLEFGYSKTIEEAEEHSGDH